MTGKLKNAWLFWAIAIAVFLGTFGCAHNEPKPWKMPSKKNPESAMIFGRIETADSSKHLLLRNVNILKKGRVYAGMGRGAIGERTTILSDNYFVAPNVEPGVYFISGFDAGNVYHVFPPATIQEFNVAAGQLKFIGSFLYEEKGGGVFSRGSFDLKPTNKPSELEMLGRLNSVSDGTGWESSIRSRIRKLGGNPDKPAQKTSN